MGAQITRPGLLDTQQWSEFVVSVTQTNCGLKERDSIAGNSLSTNLISSYFLLKIPENPFSDWLTSFLLVNQTLLRFLFPVDDHLLSFPL